MVQVFWARELCGKLVILPTIIPEDFMEKQIVYETLNPKCVRVVNSREIHLCGEKNRGDYTILMITVPFSVDLEGRRNTIFFDKNRKGDQGLVIVRTRMVKLKGNTIYVNGKALLTLEK